MVNEWQATREWKDISTKWRLVPAGLRSARPDDPFAQGWQALEAGRLDQAEQLFSDAVRHRGDGNDYVALGDVHAARRDWVKAAGLYQRALLVAPLSVLAVLGLALTRAATGEAQTAIAELQVLANTRKGDPVVGYYLAVTLLARTVEVRVDAPGGRLVIADAEQLATCEDLARRIAVSGTDDPQLLAAARELLEEARTGRDWVWTDTRAAIVLAVLIGLLGVVPVILGGALGSWPIFLVGLVIGAALVFVVIHRYLRQRWQQRALSHL